MPFQKCNKLSPGGKIGNKGGRPKKKDVEIREAAAEIARRYIEDRINPLMESYFKLIKGRTVKYYDKTGELSREEEVIDTRAVCHAVDTILPKAAQQIEVSGAVGVFRIDAFDPRNPDRPRLINNTDDDTDDNAESASPRN